MPLSRTRLFDIVRIIICALAWWFSAYLEEDGDASTAGTATSRLDLMANPRLIFDVDDVLVSDSNPARNDGRGLDYARCARLHNYLVAYGWMAYHQRGPEDLDELLTRPTFFERQRDDSEVLRDRLDAGLISYLESIIIPDTGISYWVENVQVTPADELFFVEENDLNDKERFIILYGSWYEHGGHTVGLIYTSSVIKWP